MAEFDTHPLDHIMPIRKTGVEPLHQNGTPLPWTLLDFWQWSASDLINNALRGQIAEYLVACALGVTAGLRIEWAAYDLQTATGTTIEVKSAAYLQSWRQRRFSAISFDIRPTRAWQEATSRYDDECKRQADVYVFALLKHQDKATLDPLNVAQWDFYVVGTTTLTERMANQQRISLTTLLRLQPTCSEYGGLSAAVQHCAGPPIVIEAHP